MSNPIVDIAGKALGEALSNLVVKACTVIYGSASAVPPPAPDLGAYVLESAITGSNLIVSHADIDDIADLLQTPEVAAIAQSYVLLACIQNRHSGLDAHLKDIEAAFHAFAKSWGSIRGSVGAWTHDPTPIWSVLTENMQFAAPDRAAVSRLPEEDVAKIVETTNAGQRILQNPVERYIRLIVDVTQDVERVNATRELCADICQAMKQNASEMHLDHVSERHRFSHDDLYVRRTITPRTDKSHFDLQKVFDSPIPGARLVVFGHPGVGKSTLMNRFVHMLSTRPTQDFAPVVIRCRELGTDLDKSCLEHVRRTVDQDLGISAEDQQIEDLLAVGRAFVIYDGVDEVTDLQQRRKLIKAIELLASSYPLTSIICTTRKIGYESASFTKAAFPTFELEEYSNRQVVEYSERWFRLMGRPDADRLAFLNESEEISEIRKNPLMLSLLCTLYRVRGFIPMNRRDVYKECADLLFYSWDALRRIPQPVDHRRYGHTLMEELADLFFKFPSTAGGIEEHQLTRLVAGYFVDTAGVEPADAQIRAKEFLAFCAGRAWLLTARGHNERGDRLFSFTHRTFMEFYAAEALVRRAKDQASVLETALDVYRQNPSSVLTDLIFEAYENKQHRGAELLLRDLLREGADGRKVAAGTHIPLCLRVLNSTPVGAPLVTEVVVAAFIHWSQNDRFRDDGGSAPRRSPFEKRGFVSLLQLYKDPRRICRRLLLEEGYGHKFLLRAHGENPEDLRRQFRLSFLRRWSELAVVGETSAYSEEWDELARGICEAEGPKVASIGSAIHIYMALSGIVPVKKEHIEKIPLTLKSFGQVAPGLLMRSLGSVLFDDPTELHLATVRAADSLLQRKPIRVTEAVADSVDGALVKMTVQFSASQIAHPNVDSAAVRVALWFCLVAAENNPGSLHVFQQSVQHLFPDQLLYRMFRTRLGVVDAMDATDEIADLEPLTPAEKRNLLSHFPQWMNKWVSRRLDLMFGVSG